MVLGETEENIRKEMDGLIQGKDASWNTGTLRRTSRKEANLIYEPLHMPWKISMEHELTTTFNGAYKSVFGHVPERYDFWISEPTR